MSEEGSIDDFIRQVQEDEARDAVEMFDYVSIGDFARARGVRPQLIHYYLRTGKLTRATCNGCGQLRLITKEANELFDKLQPRIPKQDESEEGWAVSWISPE